MANPTDSTTRPARVSAMFPGARGGSGLITPAPLTPWQKWTWHYMGLDSEGHITGFPCDDCNVDEDRFCLKGRRLREAV